MPHVIGWVSVEFSQGQPVVHLGNDRNFDVWVSCDGKRLLLKHQFVFSRGELCAKFSVI